MPEPASYAWGKILVDAVPIGGLATIATPGFADPTNYDTANAEIAYGGEVLAPDEFTAAWASDFSSVDITNNSDETWPPQDAIAIAVAGIPFDATRIEESFTALAAQVAALETRVTRNEGDIAALQPQVAANTSSVAALGPRVTTVEAVAATNTTDIVALQGRVTALETSTANSANDILALQSRVTTLERSEFDPVVSSQTLSYVPISTLSPTAQVYTMSASNGPITAWAKTYEILNNNPTSYCTIDAAGNVFVSAEGIAVFADGDTLIVTMNATNQYTTSADGFLWMTMRA